MKTCDSYRNHILLADSGELAEAELYDLARHLDGCFECRRFQSDARSLTARSTAALAACPPPLDIPQLNAQARHWRRRILRIQFAMALSAAAAILLALVGPGQWFYPYHGNSGQPVPQHLALLDEWQFWMISYVGQQDHGSTATAFPQGWNERDFARHLLALEGLLPEEETGIEEEIQESTPGALPPITLRGCNTPELLRS
jgi:hypothetical protein